MVRPPVSTLGAAVFGRRNDTRDPLERALEAAGGLKAGSWASVRALSLLSVAARGRPEAATLCEAAREAAGGLLDGSWESVEALACLASAERALGSTEG